MARLPEAVKNAIAEQEVFPVATSDRDGTPNVAYIKYLKVVDDETVLMADNYLAKTRDNIVNNGKVAFVVLDEEKGSFQVKGTAQRFIEGPFFDEMRRWVPDRLPREAAVVMQVEDLYNGADRLA